MRKSITSAVVFAGLLAAIPLASASDLPARSGSYRSVYQQFAPITYWSGWYAGVNGGGAWTDDTKGGLIGAQLGYNWQHQNMVFGLRTDLGYNSARGSVGATALGITATETARTPLFGSTVALLGYSPAQAPQWLFYGAGGLAYTEVNYDLVLSGAVVGSANARAFKTGPVIGGGIGYAFSPNWNMTVEYNHAWFRGDTVTYTIPPAVAAVTHDSFGVDAVKLGLNYRF